MSFIIILMCIVYINATVHPNEVVIKVLGGSTYAKYIATQMGFTFKGPVRGFHHTYLLLPNLSLDDNETLPNYIKRAQPTRNEMLHNNRRLLWLEKQQVKKRVKRDMFDTNDLFRNDRELPTFNDELWNQQWYMQDNSRMRLNLNVLPLYHLGITGRNVRIAILDDGIEYTHADLRVNYAPEISYDCNENDADPMPHYVNSTKNNHGTRCAGEIAMVANNGKCGVGIAYNARVGGIRMLDGPINDRIEGMALSYAQHLVDIYSASWGPNDDGRTVDGPGRLAQEALEQGVNKGRNGKGAIFVWASGNGGGYGDDCNCDGYLTSPYTISIGSTSQRGQFPWYGEACASTMAVTYSSGANREQMIATTDLKNGCTVKHSGTSASAPLAAGIIALALEVNPELSWRDVQHLIVWTSEVRPLAEDPTWTRNGAGFWTSNRFGFGLMNALSMVLAAANWTSVPKAHKCELHVPQISDTMMFSPYKPLRVHFKTSTCMGAHNNVVYLEHVQVELDIRYALRGAVEIYLKSPSGTSVQLLGARPLDTSPDGFRRWKFMSVMTWGEYAHGHWTLTFQDTTGPLENYGVVENISIILFGTDAQPLHMRHGPRGYT